MSRLGNWKELTAALRRARLPHDRPTLYFWKRGGSLPELEPTERQRRGRRGAPEALFDIPRVVAGVRKIVAAQEQGKRLAEIAAERTAALAVGLEEAAALPRGWLKSLDPIVYGEALRQAVLNVLAAIENAPEEERGRKFEEARDWFSKVPFVLPDKKQLKRIDRDAQAALAAVREKGAETALAGDEGPSLEEARQKLREAGVKLASDEK